MWALPLLETNRLILRAVKLEDAPHIFKYSSRDEVSRFVLWEPHKTLQDTEKFITDYFFKNYEKQIPEAFAITFKTNPDIVIGTCGAYWGSEPMQVMEMGYVLSNDFWGQGLMTEAVKAVIKFAFENYRVNRIQAHFKSENIGSGKVMERAGMTFEGAQRQRVLSKGRFWDTHHYAILKSELQS